MRQRGWRDNRAGLRRTNNLGCPIAALHKVMHIPEGMWVQGPGYVARSKALLCPSSRSAFPGAESTGASLSGISPSTDSGVQSSHLSYSFASLLPPWGTWRWHRGGDRPAPAVLLLQPRGVQILLTVHSSAELHPGADTECCWPCFTACWVRNTPGTNWNKQHLKAYHGATFPFLPTP